MFLRVNFRDNDFTTVVFPACQAVMMSLAKGFDGKKAVENYVEEKKEFGLELIRKSIVLSAYGYYIAEKGTEIRRTLKKVTNFSFNEMKILKYLDKNISIEEIQQRNEIWENSQVCYIDFYAKKVYIQ